MVFSLSGEYLGSVIMFHRRQSIVFYVNREGIDYVAPLTIVTIVCPD